MTNQSNGPDSRAAVYVAWPTFKRAIEQLTEEPVNRVDRTVFPNLAGGVQNQLFAAFKFLGLTGDDGRTTPLLRELAVPDESARKEKLAAILRERYAALFKIDLAKTTLGELTEEMGKSYGVSGSSRRKAVRFFLAATTYTGVSLSPRLTSRVADGASSPVRKKRGPNRTLKDETRSPVAANPANPGRTFNLRVSGTVTLTCSADVMTMAADDRDFFFKLVDELTEYEAKNKQ